MLAVVKSGFSSLNNLGKIDMSDRVTTAMTKNADVYPSPNPIISIVITATLVMKAAYDEARIGGANQKAALKLRVKELEALISQLAAYVQMASGGDPERILLSGFGVRSPRKPVVLPPQPENIKAVASVMSGQILLSCSPVPGAKSYFTEKSVDGIGNWIFCATSTSKKLTITGLPSATYVWFRITAINSLGQSTPSAAVRVLVG